MSHPRMLPTVRMLIVAGLVLPAAAIPAHATEPLLVCATIPELASLAATVGGEDVTTTVFTKPTEDPHFTPARPSLVKTASRCDLLLLNGLDLEIGWLPILLQGSRNATIQPGRAGYLDASTVIEPLLVPQGPVDRAMGDVHPLGNPHYLTDPLNGLRVARLIHDTLARRRPAGRAGFETRLAALERALYGALVGPALATRYGKNVEKLARLHTQNALLDFLESQHERALLGGWIGALAPSFGARYVDDHRMWPYFARRFGLAYAGSLEPLSGIPPTTRHLQAIIAMMQATDVPLLLTSSYYDPRHARFVADKTGSAIVRMASQTGAVPAATDYLATCDYNVHQVARALEDARGE